MHLKEVILYLLLFMAGATFAQPYPDKHTPPPHFMNTSFGPTFAQNDVELYISVFGTDECTAENPNVLFAARIIYTLSDGSVICQTYEDGERISINNSSGVRYGPLSVKAGQNVYFELETSLTNASIGYCGGDISCFKKLTYCCITNTALYDCCDCREYEELDSETFWVKLQGEIYVPTNTSVFNRYIGVSQLYNIVPNTISESKNYGCKCCVF